MDCWKNINPILWLRLQISYPHKVVPEVNFGTPPALKMFGIKKY